MNEKSLSDDDLIPIARFYSDAEKIGFSVRTLQWYVTEGLLPKPVHVGKEAYYKLSKCPIYDYLSIIKILKDDCKFSLGKIRTVIDNYKKKREDIEKLNEILMGLADHYPIMNSLRDFHNPRKYSSHELTYDTAKRVREMFYFKIIAGININEIHLTGIQSEVEIESKPEW